MGRYRSRSRSFSPRRYSRSPPRGSSRYYYEDYRDRYRGSRRRSPPPSGLLVRNIPLDARPEDLKVPFEKYGPVKDVYLPRNYYTGEPRGFGFVKFRYPEDAAEAKQQMNHRVIGGREIRIVFAEENRKTPQEMRMSTRISGRYGSSYRRSPPPRHRHRSYSRSPTPPRRVSRERSLRNDHRSPRRSRTLSRSRSPLEDRDHRPSERSGSPEMKGHDSPEQKPYTSDKSASPRSRSRSPSKSRSRSSGSR